MSTTATDTTCVRAAYIDLCAQVRDLAQLVVSADAVRYEAPPGMALTRGETGSNVADVLNPTLDTVLDARRLALSEEIRELAAYLRTTSHVLAARRERLDRALARWEGDVRAPDALRT